MAVDKFKVICNSDVREFERLINRESWYNIVDVEISDMGVPMAIMTKRANQSTATERFKVISTTEYPEELERYLNQNPDYSVIDGEIFSTPGEACIVIIGKDNGTPGGGGTSNYEELSNLPKINGKVLIGNKDAASLELQLNANGQIAWWHSIVDPVAKRYFYPTVNNKPKTEVNAYLSLVAQAVNSGDDNKRDIPYMEGRITHVIECDLSNEQQLFKMFDPVLYKYLRVYVENGYVRIAAVSSVNSYSELTNKPQINGVELNGNKTYSALDLEAGWNKKLSEFVETYGNLTLTNSTFAEWATWISTHTTNGHYSVAYDNTLAVEAWVITGHTHPLQFLLNGQIYGKNASEIKPLNVQMTELPASVQTLLTTATFDSGTFN